MSIDDGNVEFADLAHERLIVPEGDIVIPSMQGTALASMDFDSVSHLVSVAAGESPARGNVRDRLARFLDRVSGPSPQR